MSTAEWIQGIVLMAFWAIVGLLGFTIVVILPITLIADRCQRVKSRRELLSAGASSDSPQSSEPA